MQDAAAMLRRTERADRNRVQESVRRSLQTMPAWRCEFRLRRPQGAVGWLRGSATPQRVSDGSVLWHGYIEDVSELRELEQARPGRCRSRQPCQDRIPVADEP